MEAAAAATYIPVGLTHMAAVDAADAAQLAQYRWLYNGRYAYAKVSGGVVLMHRLVLGALNDQLVDHIDGDGLNNRRSNLRSCTHAENMRNRCKTAGLSRFKGVHRDKRTWRAQINFEGRRIRLGSFHDEADAARAYDSAASLYHGEFAKTNEALGLY